MRLFVPVSTLRPAKILTTSHCHCHRAARALVVQRNYASTGGSGAGSSSATSKRRAVTPFNDDGHVPWADLSAAEKTSRAAQQTFNFGFIIVGVVLTVCGALSFSLWPSLVRCLEPELTDGARVVWAIFCGQRYSALSLR